MNLKDLFDLCDLPKGRLGSQLKPLVITLVGLGLVSALGCSGSTQAQLEEIRSLHQAGQFDPSIAPLRQLLADEPGNPEANYLLGIALKQTGMGPPHKAGDDKCLGSRFSFDGLSGEPMPVG